MRVVAVLLLLASAALAKPQFNDGILTAAERSFPASFDSFDAGAAANSFSGYPLAVSGGAPSPVYYQQQDQSYASAAPALTGVDYSAPPSAAAAPPSFAIQPEQAQAYASPSAYDFGGAQTYPSQVPAALPFPLSAPPPPPIYNLCNDEEVPSVTPGSGSQSLSPVPHQERFDQGFDGHSQHGDAKVYKHVYAFAAPDEPAIPPKITVEGASGRSKHYKLIFIKTPSQAAPVSSDISIPSQQEEKTIIYVLSKEQSHQPEIRIKTTAHESHSKPEVFFIKYKNEEEAQAIASGAISGKNSGVPAHGEIISDSSLTVNEPQSNYQSESQIDIRGDRTSQQSTGFSGASQQSTGFSGASQQSTGYSGASQQSTGFSGASQQSTGYSGASQQSTGASQQSTGFSGASQQSTGASQQSTGFSSSTTTAYQPAIDVRSGSSQQGAGYSGASQQQSAGFSSTTTAAYQPVIDVRSGSSQQGAGYSGASQQSTGFSSTTTAAYQPVIDVRSGSSQQGAGYSGASQQSTGFSSTTTAAYQPVIDVRSGSSQQSAGFSSIQSSTAAYQPSFNDVRSGAYRAQNSGAAGFSSSSKGASSQYSGSQRTGFSGFSSNLPVRRIVSIGVDDSSSSVGSGSSFGSGTSFNSGARYNSGYNAASPSLGISSNNKYKFN